MMPDESDLHERTWMAFFADDFAAGYIGYYVCNGTVIMQGFGDKTADQNASDILQKEFPTKHIEQINIDGIASGGGSIHCAIQQEPDLSTMGAVCKNLEQTIASRSSLGGVLV